MKRYGRIILLFSASAVYLSIGAGIFTLIEGPHEMRTRQELNRTIEQFMKDNPSLSMADLAEFLREVRLFSKKMLTLLNLKISIMIMT